MRFSGLLLFVSVCFAPAFALAGIDATAIYGEDSRVEFHEISDPRIRNLSESVGALFYSSDLSFSGPSAGFSAPSYQNYQDLCPDQPFLTQPTAAFCSGVLVGTDLFMTAGHCVKTDEECPQISVGFGYRLNSPAGIPQSIPRKELYSCKKILARKYFRTGVDYALIQLDRPVSGRPPLAIRASAPPSIGTEVFLLGYPVGLPLKYSSAARVRKVSSGVFVANADAFSGNSGSPVFNAMTFEIEGLLVRGEPDFDRDPQRGCNVERRCPNEGCSGETATLVQILEPVLNRKSPVPQIEEGAANASPVDARAWLRTVIRVPSSMVSRRFEILIEVYSRESRGFQAVHRAPLTLEAYGGQHAFEIAFSIQDPTLLVLGSVNSRITLLMDGKPVDSELLPIMATR